MIESLLSRIAELIGHNMWLAPLLALAAGVLTTLTPCSLSTIPLILGYVGGTGVKEPKRAFAYSVVFSAGSTVTFVALGIIATLAGHLINTSSHIWHIILGLLLIVMALQLWGIIRVIPSTDLVSKNQKRGFAGAFVSGLLAGVFSSHCSTPVLVALLAMLADKGNMMWGVLLMLLYSIGHSVLILLAGTSVGLIQKISQNKRYKKVTAIIKIVMGTVILLAGIYNLTDVMI